MPVFDFNHTPETEDTKGAECTYSIFIRMLLRQRRAADSVVLKDSSGSITPAVSLPIL